MSEPSFSKTWPAEPVRAWREAVREPDPYVRLEDAPDADGADAFSIDDWVQAQRPTFPVLGTALLVIGVSFAVQALTQGAGQQNIAVWIIAAVLLISAVILLAEEVRKRRTRRANPTQALPDAQTVVCELKETAFKIDYGDGFRTTCVAIDAEVSDEQAARISTAFRIWLDQLQADAKLGLAARKMWQPYGATLFTSDEIFGREARGGYLVRRPNPPSSGWGAIVTPRRPKSAIGDIRLATVLRWDGNEWRL